MSVPAEILLLLIPAALGVAATITGHIPLKMGVPIASTVIILGLVAAGRVDGLHVGFITGALIASAVGDFFLSSKAGRSSFFIVGIGLYFIAHLGYLAGAWIHGGPSLPVLVVLLAVFLVYYVVSLRRAIDEPVLSVAVLLYLLVSCVALAVAAGIEWTGAPRILFITAIGLIVLSDLAISFDEFLEVHTFNALILPPYYLAHIAITAALILR